MAQPSQSTDYSLTEENMPLVISKIKLLQQTLDLNAAEYAQSIGISSATMSRINADRGASVSMKTVQKIVEKTRGVSMDWFFDASSMALPAGLDIAPPPKNDNWEGTRLRRFRKRHELDQIQIAEASNTAPSNYSLYEKSQQIRPEIREKILDAFTRLLGRPVSELEVFGRTADLRPLPDTLSGSFPIPRIPLSMRSKLTPALIESLQYQPANQQATEQVYYIDSRLLHASQENIPAGQLTDYFALEYGSNDRMEPLRAGGWLLAQLMDPSQYVRLADELVAVVTRHGGVYIRRIQRNALASATPELVLVPYLNGGGAQISVRADDINMLFYVPTILHGPL